MLGAVDESRARVLRVIPRRTGDDLLNDIVRKKAVA